MNHVFKKAENRKVTMTDVEQAREALVRRGHPLGGVTVWENLIRAVVAEMRAAEVPPFDKGVVTVRNAPNNPSPPPRTPSAAFNAPVSEPAKRMMLANTKAGFNNGYHSVFWHVWHESCKDAGCEFGRVEDWVPKKRTVSAEARRKIVYALYRGYTSAEERADRIIAIIEADGAEASA